MKKKIFLLIICTIVFIPVSVYAYDFSNYDVRKNYNLKKYTQLNQSPSYMFKDIYLKDMYETDYKGMTSTQQMKIKELRNLILNDPDYTCNEGDSVNLCKLRKFHDWIKNNFYYYNPVNSTNASKIGLKINQYDNPYYVLTKNKLSTSEGSHYVSRCNGYTSVLIALARNEGIPARSLSGYYNTTDGARTFSSDSNKKWSKNPNENTLSHAWVTAFVDNKWIVIDANADSYNAYSVTKKCSYQEDGVRNNNGNPSSFTTQADCTAANYSWTNWTMSEKAWVSDGDKSNKYFNVSAANLSDSHIIFQFRSGSRELKYISHAGEVKKLKTFLNKKTSGKTNGKRINTSYSTAKPETWFIKGDTKSLGNGYGRLYKLYWPSKKGLWGRLDLSGFTALQNLSVPSNKITSLYLKNCPSLSTVAASNNKLSKVIVTGSKKLTLLSIQGNPTTYVKYNFATAPKTAIIKANKGGTVSVKYSKSGTKYVHTMKAISKKGYKFKGWYKGSKRISKKVSFTTKKNASFTYTAKFIKR